jgi:IclR family acetate operon transcriptional repressor
MAGANRTAAEIAADLGVNRSTGLRLLQELENLGYVRRDPSKRYTVVSERFLPMATADGHHVDWHEAINPILERIRDEVGESTLLATPANGVMVYVTFFDSPHTVAVRERLGTVRPMHASALGKAWLSALPPEELDATLGQIDYSTGTDLAPSGPLDLRKRVGEASERGYAIDIGESVDGVTCVAAPARIGEVAVGAVAVSAPSDRLPAEKTAQIGTYLAESLGMLRGTPPTVSRLSD